MKKTPVICPKCRQLKRGDIEMNFVKTWETEAIDLHGWDLKPGKSHKVLFESYVCPVCGKTRDIEAGAIK